VLLRLCFAVAAGIVDPYALEHVGMPYRFRIRQLSNLNYLRAKSGIWNRLL
jgi:hypothetical protein